MISPTSATGPAITMSVLADKASQGFRLTHPEQLIVMTNAAQIFSSSFGPMPADMRIRAVQLPENVKGVLASFAL